MTNRKHQASQQGVALMMTLGVLSLVLILAMSFSFTARSSRQLSQNNAEVVRARLLANSGLNRVIAAIGASYSPKDPLPGNEDKVEYEGREHLVFPATSGTFFAIDTNPATSIYGSRYFWMSTNSVAAKRDQDGLEAAIAADIGVGTNGTPLPTGFQNFGFLPLIDSTRLPTTASWHHVTAQEPWIDRNSNGAIDAGEYEDINESGSWDEHLIGRISFVVIDESGKIDPNGVLTANLNSEPRPGLSPIEIRTLYSMPDLWNDMTEKPGGGKTKWFSWRHIGACLEDVVGKPVNWSPAVTDNHLRSYFPYSYDIEAYRLDLHEDDGDIPTPPPLYEDIHRFDIWNVDWNGTTWDEAALRSLYDGTVARFWLSTPGGTTNPTASTCAPALGEFTNDEITLQVLANLADFLDKDDNNKVTWIDYDGNGIPSEGDIYGLEETPYINKVAFLANYSHEENDPLDPDDDTGSIAFQTFVELANIYEAAVNFSSCEVHLTLQFRNSEEDITTYQDITIGTGGVFAVVGPGTSINSKSYMILTKTETLSIPPGAPESIALRVTSCRVLLKDIDGDIIDFAAPVSADSFEITNEITGDGATFRAGSLEANDPRCNTKEIWWLGRYDNLSGYADIHLEEPNRVASIDLTGGDREDGDIMNISTAYIANRADITFWELGAIHRGEPWRTINLKLHYYDPPSTLSPYTPSYRSYEQGDAVLLEQLKLGSATEVQGRVNANCADLYVWQQVLDGLQVGCSYANRTSPGAAISGTGTLPTTVTATQRDQLADKLSGLSAMLSRAEIVTESSLYDGTVVPAQTNDRTQEEIIGKITNLLTVRQNIFTVLVTAQTVRDTGTNRPSASRWAEYDKPNGKFCAILAEHKLLATVYRDAFTNTFRVVNIETLED